MNGKVFLYYLLFLYTEKSDSLSCFMYLNFNTKSWIWLFWRSHFCNVVFDFFLTCSCCCVWENDNKRRGWAREWWFNWLLFARCGVVVSKTKFHLPPDSVVQLAQWDCMVSYAQTSQRSIEGMARKVDCTWYNAMVQRSVLTGSLGPDSVNHDSRPVSFHQTLQ